MWLPILPRQGLMCATFHVTLIIYVYILLSLVFLTILVLTGLSYNPSCQLSLYRRKLENTEETGEHDGNRRTRRKPEDTRGGKRRTRRKPTTLGRVDNLFSNLLVIHEENTKENHNQDMFWSVVKNVHKLRQRFNIDNDDDVKIIIRLSVILARILYVEPNFLPDFPGLKFPYICMHFH